jgi:ABC-type Fe3+/spermidine/putrescine transport system ATPase subunit
VINDGRILQIGPPEELYHRPNCAFVASFLGGVNLLAGRVAAGADGTVFTADEVALRVTGSAVYVDGGANIVA